MCGRLHSVWHARMREMDRANMVPALVAAARRRPPAVACDNALMAFRVFTLQPGQEHWRCACGRAAEPEAEREIARLLAGEAEADEDDSEAWGWVFAATILFWIVVALVIYYGLARWLGIIR
jgi:hypothetical protein